MDLGENAFMLPLSLSLSLFVVFTIFFCFAVLNTIEFHDLVTIVYTIDHSVRWGLFFLCSLYN